MSVIKRAMCYVTRKKTKTLIMFFILFAISTAMISGIAIKKAMNASKGQMYASIQSGFSLEINREYNWGNARGGGNIPKSIIEQIAKVDGIKEYHAKMIAEANIDGMESVALTNKNIKIDNEYEQMMTHYVQISGISNSEKDNKFMSGILKLSEGRHLEKNDVGKVLVHETFAKQNNLKIGDIVKIKQFDDDPLIQKKSNNLTSLEIIGFFTGENATQPTTRAEMVENVLMTDLQTVKEFYGYSEDSGMYQSVNYFVKDPIKLDEVMQEAKKLPINWKDYALFANQDNFPGITNSMESLDGLIQMVLIGSVVISIGVLALILTFWIQGRIHETGILMSIGLSKINIITQYILELLIIAFFAFGLSLFSGKMVAQNIGDQLVAQAKESGVQSIYQNSGGPIGADPETSTLTATIDELDVSVSMSEMGLVWLSGTGIIVCAVVIASSSIIRLKPKEILSKMS